MKKDCTKQDFADWLDRSKTVHWIDLLGITHILSCVDDDVAICDAKSESEFELLNDIREMFYSAYYDNFEPNLSGKFF